MKCHVVRVSSYFILSFLIAICVVLRASDRPVATTQFICYSSLYSYRVIDFTVQRCVQNDSPVSICDPDNVDCMGLALVLVPLRAQLSVCWNWHGSHPRPYHHRCNSCLA
jgi:hypothetical protein